MEHEHRRDYGSHRSI